jgi:plastocyanin
VRIEGMKFMPERLEVTAGDRITFTNADFVPHSVTARANRIESGDLGQGKSWTYVARGKGEIAYICRLHPVMRGVVVVK